MTFETHFIIIGNVQGVGFRKATKHYATKFGLHGYVKNLHNGSVQICVQGDEKKAYELIESLKKAFHIQSISINKLPIRKNFDSFEIEL